MATIGQNADPTLTLESLLQRSEVAVVGIDGGGLDDLLGFAVIGREKNSADEPRDAPDGGERILGRWLHWGHAWAHAGVLERRKEIAPKLLDFAADGDLTIVGRIGEDVIGVADYVDKIRAAGLLPERAAIGVDQAGIGAIVDELAERQIDSSKEAGVILGIPQGWRLMPAIKTTERKLAGGEFVHGGRRLMAWCVGNAKVEVKGNAISITKQAAGIAKIDPLMALFNAVALMSMNPRSDGRGIFEFYRSAAAAAQPHSARKAAATMRLRAPAGVSNLYGMSGRAYAVDSDGTVEVEEKDAPSLLALGFEAVSTTLS